MENPLKRIGDEGTWTLALLLYVGLNGLSFQVRGPLLRDIQNTFLVSESLLGLIGLFSTIGFASFALFSGLVVGRIDVRKVLLIGIGSTALLTSLVGLSPVYVILLGLLSLRGVAAGVPGGICRPMLGHLHSQDRGRIFNINEAVWAAGAAGGPLFVTLVSPFGGWRLVYLLVGFLLLPVFLIMALTGFPSSGFEEEPLNLGDLKNMLKNPVLIGILAAVFFNVGVEGGFFTWLPYFLEGSFSESVANLTLSGFLVSYIPARLVNGMLLEKIENYKLILLNSGGILVLLVLAFYILEGYAVIVAVLFVGYLIAGIWPVLFTWAVELFPEYSGPINGLFMTVDPLGIALIPAVMGLLAEYFDILTAMRFMILPMLGVFAAGLVLRWAKMRG